jgi:TPR repeat protein
MRKAAKRMLSIALAAALLMLVTPVAARAGDAEDCASTTIAADRSAAACRRLAEQGKAWAQYNLGLAYDKGEGVKQDDTEAVKWYRKAAEQGHARAQNNLGWMYAHGEGVPQDYAEAARWSRKAAEQGHPGAQNRLGIMYDNGQGVPQDDAEAVKWYRRAAEQGSADAQHNLGTMYEAGEGVTKDLVSAYLWFDLAARAYPAGKDRDDAIKHRDGVAAKMTADQVAKAKTLAAEWKPGGIAGSIEEDVLVVSSDVITFYNGAYKRLHLPKAIAVSADGLHLGYSYCSERYGCKIVPSARDLAMQACARAGGQRCRIFALDDEIKVKYRVMDLGD